ncbi:MAG: Uma2 family endonuclease [Calditrichaeota bacterium]|nr:MAG: Uma2 family endonuclease [Calditrichota bacterium]
MQTKEIKQFYTIEEYLEFEDQADTKHQLYNGEIFAMSGATLNHNIIASYTSFALMNAFKGKPCIVTGADLKVQIEKNGLFTYPDVSIFCGEPEFYKNRNDTITNPILIVEVLSDSIEAFERGKKFELYRTLESFKHYILISQKEIHVEYYFKNEKSNWELEEFKEMKDILKIHNLNVEISLEEIYSKVKFETDKTQSNFLN